MADMSAGKLVGIDLGTTFSAIATLDDHGQAVCRPDVRQWQVNGAAGKALAERLWRSFLDAGAPRPTDYRFRVPLGGPSGGDLRASATSDMPGCVGSVEGDARVGGPVWAASCGAVSQRRRKLVEQPFGWMKTVGLLRKLRHRGGRLVDWILSFTAAAYNLVRWRNLVTRPA